MPRAPAGWIGPVLLGAGLIAAAILLLLPSGVGNTLTWWLRKSIITPERLLPLAGLGVALGLDGFRRSIFGTFLLLAGLMLGFAEKQWLVAHLGRIPGATGHMLLAGPISCIAVGLVLAPGTLIRQWLSLPVAALIGIMLALAIKMTDPSFHDPVFPRVGSLAGLWTVAAVAFTVSVLPLQWLPVAGRILGSWLIAIGVLYGGASFLPKPKPQAVRQKKVPVRPGDVPGSEFEYLFPKDSRSGEETRERSRSFEPQGEAPQFEQVR
jgi:hypothetical protein